MKKINLVKKEDLPKLVLGGVTVFTLSWTLIYLTGLALVQLINVLFGSFQTYSDSIMSGFPDGSALFQLGFLSGVIILVALILLVISVAYDEYYFSRELKGFEKRLFWGASWGLIFVMLDKIVGSICFNRVGYEGVGFSCMNYSISNYTGVFYWLFVLLIVILPVVSEHYGRAKASYKK